MTFKLEPGKNCTEYAYVGSRVTCNPAPTDTDRDILVLCVEGEMREVMQQIYDAGGDACGLLDYDVDMVAMRLGAEDNYLLTEDEDYYLKFLAVTAVARGLNIMDKSSRHAMFKCLLDDDYSLVGGPISRVMEVPF